MSKVGTAARWNEEGGFGFIKQSDGGPDIFVHRSALGRDRDTCLIEGETVFYDVVVDERSGKDRATNVSGPAVSSGGSGGAGYHNTPLGDGCTYTPHDIQDMLEDRQIARRMRDFQKADRIRDDLRANGIIIDDRTMVWESRSGERGTYGYGPDGRQTHAMAMNQQAEAMAKRMPGMPQSGVYSGSGAKDEPYPGMPKGRGLPGKDELDAPRDAKYMDEMLGKYQKYLAEFGNQPGGARKRSRSR
eukprot:TRINITY_DN8520_c0_g1_i1.p1 TRINITY_DN8520_c0_g1~~TRINITY_DN8520_c0_g1_i1.p1  ORF type:complete len:276 (+),score=74.47 TRINITY_DN8520_c0_g1_i1:94-828(+)